MHSLTIKQEGNVMKILSFALLLMAGTAFVLSGCSDNSAPTVAPTDQPTLLKVQTPLAKMIMTHFTGIEHPTGLLDPGVPSLEGGKMIVKGLVITASWEDGFDKFPLVKGTLVIDANVRLDVTTGEGLEYGTFTLTPDANVGGGVWKARWEGYRHKVGASEWAARLEGVGYGKGGTIDGMKLLVKEVIHTSDLQGSKPYIGNVEGAIKSHETGEREEDAREPSDHF
jgi:hypothetical protein